MDKLARKLPNCPKCKEDELWLTRRGYLFRLRCYLCGWDSDEIEQVGAIDEAVTNAVAFYGEV